MLDVYITNDKAYVWRAQDVSKLREDHRIVGTLVGCLPRLPRQNVQLGLPLQLLPEEVTLLLDKGIIHLIKNDVESHTVTESEKEEFHRKREELYRKQVELCRESARCRIMQNLPTIIEGLQAKKRKEMEERRAAGEDVSDSELENVDFDVDGAEIPTLPEKHSCIQIPTARILSECFSEAAWHFPSTPEEILHYRVYKDLHDRGYWLTSGGKFGGDYLVYPGDPVRFHSSYIAVCVEYNKKVMVQDLTAFSRLGANVKKTVILCSLDNSDHVVYTSIKWTGIT